MGKSSMALIRERHSVRTFDGNALKETDRLQLESCLSQLANPFGIPVEFRLLNAGEHHLSSPVIVGTDLYLAAKVKRQEHFELAYGYSFESVCLYAQSLGIGTVMLAATLSRDTFEKAMALREGEVLPCVSPVGYPAAKRSIRETMMRKAIRADDRLPFEQLFCDGSFGRPLSCGAAGALADCLEMVRLAPSAANRQPWRAVVQGRAVHFYELKSMKDSPLGDIQKVDMGIALSHFDLAAQEKGIAARFVFEDPGLSAPGNMHYIVSCEVTA